MIRTIELQDPYRRPSTTKTYGLPRRGRARRYHEGPRRVLGHQGRRRGTGFGQGVGEARTGRLDNRRRGEGRYVFVCVCVCGLGRVVSNAEMFMANVSRIVHVSSKLAEVTFGYRRGASDVAWQCSSVSASAQPAIVYRAQDHQMAHLLHVYRLLAPRLPGSSLS